MEGVLFELGDVVVLKSGGPEMTVSIVSPEGLVKCMWYEKPASKFMHCIFPQECLVRVANRPAE